MALLADCGYFALLLVNNLIQCYLDWAHIGIEVRRPFTTQNVPKEIVH